MMSERTSFCDSRGLMLGRQVCIPQGHLIVRMAEQFPNRIEVRTRHDEV
jgi:hypothetical protein